MGFWRETQQHAFAALVDEPMMMMIMMGKTVHFPSALALWWEMAIVRDGEFLFSFSFAERIGLGSAKMAALMFFHTNNYTLLRAWFFGIGIGRRMLMDYGGDEHRAGTTVR